MKDSALPPDPEIIRGLRAADPETLELLVTAYREALVRYADRILGHPGRGDDAVQETFIRLWCHRTTLHPQGSLRALLYTMTRNAAIDELRRERRHRARTSAAEPTSPRPSPFDDAAEAELAERASAAVAALPPRRREVFRLVREDGLSYREVADIMEIRYQTVANHMSLALADLRESLARAATVPLTPGSGRRDDGGNRWTVASGDAGAVHVAGW